MSINKRAIASGALGATASFIGKLALSPNSPVPSAIHSICIASWGTNLNPNDHTDANSYLSPSWLCPIISLAARGICLLCMIGVNAIMISSFVEGMNESGSVVGTALSTAANFSCSVGDLV